MPRFSILIGIGLMLAGAMGYSMAHKESVTALIPSFIGIFMAISGLIVLDRESLAKNILRINILLAFLAMAGAASRLPYAMIAPEEHLTQLIVLCEVVFLTTVYLMLATREFIRLKKQQKSAAII